MDYQNIRQAFVQYFTQAGHTHVPSASLIPAGDRSIMFTNAGMNQFKEVFSGHDKRPYSKAVSVQRCLRAGGKHNDLENVGYTSRHHTFFEMLGNFSFADYFKEEAIDYALNFILKELELPFEKLLVTVHQSDDQAFELWKKKGFDERKIIRCSDKDNFWAMGDVGPCGPCSEIFYDLGPAVQGGPPGSAQQEGDRFKEIWNLVFMQYFTQSSGHRENLPQPCVDTGMGLERLASVIEGVDSNYKTSFFVQLKKHLAEILNLTEQQAAHADVPLNILADHLRASAYMIHDQMLPNNEGRGYVLRRIIRRALRYGYKLGAKTPFLDQGLDQLITLMGQTHSALRGSQDLIESTLRKEQEQFFNTLDSGLKYLDKALEDSPNGLSAEVLFKLYDTYGFPLDIASDIAKEKDLQLDLQGYETMMKTQKDRSRADSHAAFKDGFDSHLLPKEEGIFLRDRHSIEDAKITAVVKIDSQKTYLCFDKTPFYAQAGGQVGDTGNFLFNGKSFEILDTCKQFGHHLHLIHDSHESFTVGQSGALQIHSQKRLAIERHHSATHLLHSALREVLGGHVGQKGSLVQEDKLRFDFSHPDPLTAEQIQKIEELVYVRILSNEPVITQELSYQQALDKGALAFFDDKYGDTVRMLTMGEDFSLELCGGTHVRRLGEIGSFHVLSQEAVGSGIRRVQAVAGLAQQNDFFEKRQTLETMAQSLGCATDSLSLKLDELLQTQHDLKEQLSQARWSLCQKSIEQTAKTTCADSSLSVRLVDLDPKQRAFLKQASDLVKPAKRQVDVLFVYTPEKTTIVMASSSDLKKDLSLKKVFQKLQENFDLKGGGRDDRVQAGSCLSFEQLNQLKEQLLKILIKNP